jgi:hypothetical protein
MKQQFYSRPKSLAPPENEVSAAHSHLPPRRGCFPPPATTPSPWVEWGIGTVFRDGDEMPVVNKNENENEVKGMCPRSRHDAVLTAVQSAPARVPRPLIVRRRSATSRRYVAALHHFAYTHPFVHAALVRQATGLR